MANVISKRVAEFIGQFPPFNILNQDDLQYIASQIDIQYKEPNEYIFLEHAKPMSHFFIVRQGSVRIFHDMKEDVLIDICDEGDIFGTRPLLADETYQASARTQEECLLYAIPIAVVKKIWMQNPSFAHFFQMGYASDKPMSREQLRAFSKKNDMDAPVSIPILSEVLNLDARKTVLNCSPETNISDAAKAMSEKNAGSIIISNHGLPLGIVTDKDLRQKVATGIIAINRPVTEIMSSPVICAPSGLAVAEYMIEMINKRVHHICITEDGTQATPFIGIVSDHDLLLEQGFNAGTLIKEIRKTEHIPALLGLRNKADILLQKYIDQNVNMIHIMKMMAGVNDALQCKIIGQRLAHNKLPDCQFAWLSLGSQGREEQLLRTDQDHALVFEDGANPDENDQRRIFFVGLARQISHELERFGYSYDVAGIGAQNTDWCLSVSEWKEKFSKWIKTPDPDNLLLSNIFFDFRVSFGSQGLGNLLHEHLQSELSKSNIYLSHLAKNALTNPAPLSFFRNFVVENSGEHKDTFDLKLRAMMPLCDAARVLSLHHNLFQSTNTAERFRKIAALETHHYELFLELSDAFVKLIDLRTKQGLKHKNTGRYILISDLSKIERFVLKNIFGLINDLQKILKLRFHTNLIAG